MATPIKTLKRSPGLTRNAISTLGIMIFIFYVSGSMSGLTGAVPSAMVLGSDLGVSHAHVAVGAILLLFSMGFVAILRQVTSAGVLHAHVVRGLGILMLSGAACLALWLFTMIQISASGFFGVVFTAATPNGDALLLASIAIVAFLLGVGLFYALRRRSMNPEALADLAGAVM